MTDGFQPADSARPGQPGGSSHSETPETATARSGAARADKPPSTVDAGYVAQADRQIDADAGDRVDGSVDGRVDGTRNTDLAGRALNAGNAARTGDIANSVPGTGTAASADAVRSTGVAGSAESGRDVDPEAISRKLLMGLALLLALASVYSGVFNWPKTFQMMLAAAATITLVTALRRPYGEPPRRK